MNYYIITGTSRGLGEAIAEKLLGKDNYLICISRARNLNLISLTKEQNANLSYFEYDLSNVSGLKELMSDIFDEIDLKNAGSINLINNAATVDPVKHLERQSDLEIINSFNVNLTAPVVIVSEFIKRIAEYSCEKRIINISSGAAKKPYDGWSTYCCSKAGLEMLSRCVSKEQISKTNPVKILSFDPGIIDTEMQSVIRQSDKENFSQLERFIEFKEKGTLLKPDFVARKVIEVLHSDNFQTDESVRIWDM